MENSRNKLEFNINTQTKDIFDNLFAFYGMLSPDGSVLSLNGKIFEQTSTEPHLLVGQKFSETVYWQSSEFVAGQLETAIKNLDERPDTKVLLDFRVSAENTIQIELFLQKQTGGEIFFCAQDVTQREKEIEHYKQQSERLLFAAENAEVGLWFWDLAEDDVYSTPVCNEMFEVSANEILSFEQILNIAHPEDRETVSETLNESLVNGTEYDMEYRVVYEDGNIHWIGAKGRSFLDREGNPKKLMGVFRKITDKKLASEELAKIFAREKKARDEAEEANRAKDFFLAVVSHELRSPLNAILGWAKILLTKTVDETVRRNALETIEKSARSQAKLIEDLVDSSRVASGKLRLELRPLNFYEVANTVYNLQKPIAESRKISLEFFADNDNIRVYGDAMRLQQVLSNLLSNALKFTPNEGSVSLDVRTENDSVKVLVKDTGKGIEPEILPDIFKQFRQGDEQVATSQSGLGLGLSIVKILVEKHNGTVNAASGGLGQGSTFTVTLPLYDTQAGSTVTAERDAPKRAEKPLDNVKILVVEDDADSREVLQLYLEQNGAKVKAAESASKAFTILRDSAEDLPDVIVSDLAMPEEDGYSLMSRIRKLPSEKGGVIPALALSAFAANDNKERAYSVGFQKYHTKPFEPDGIIEDIRGIIRKEVSA